MSDRHAPLPQRIGAVTAAARLLTATHHDAPKPEHWHNEAWGFRDTVGELRFAESWLGNSLSRSRLFAAKRPAPGKEPEPLEGGPAFDLVEKLAGGVGGQSDLLRQFGSYLLIPGVGYLVGEAKEHGEMYRVVNAEDLRLGRDEEDNDQYELREGTQPGDWRKLPVGSLVTKVFRPHPRHRWEPDSPTRAAIPILTELVLLTQHVEATARSRLAGAGVQFLPAEAQFPGGWDKFVEEFVRVVRTPIADRSLVAADVPFPVKIPGEYLDKIKDAFVTYATPFDEQAQALRDEAITRLGNAMDMPRQVLTGESSNHWGDWQIEESGLKLHVEPTLEIICDGLTTGYLTPGLGAASDGDEAARREIAAVLDAEPMAEFIIWYDTSDLRVRPDRGSAAQEGYDRYQVDGESLRKELGLSEAQAWDPDDEEVQHAIWMTHATSATSPLAELALKKLGLVKEDEIPKPAAPAPGAPGGEPGPPGQPGGPGQPPPGSEKPPEPGGERTLPETKEAPPAPTQPRRVPARAASAAVVPDTVAALSPGMALVAACDLLVDRALEVAGKRVLTRARAHGNGRSHGSTSLGVGDAHCVRRTDARRLHTCMDTDSYVPIAEQFVGAWDRLPETAARLGEDEEALRATLDAYVRLLVTNRHEHSWDTIAEALGVCPCEEPG